MAAKTDPSSSLLTRISPLYWLLAFVPIAIGLEIAHTRPVWILVVSGIAIVPLTGR